MEDFFTGLQGFYISRDDSTFKLSEEIILSHYMFVYTDVNIGEIQQPVTLFFQAMKSCNTALNLSKDIVEIIHHLSED